MHREQHTHKDFEKITGFLKDILSRVLNKTNKKMFSSFDWKRGGKQGIEI